MPDLDAESALGAQSTRLLDRVVQNKDLANTWMAMLAAIANTAAERGAKMDGIEIGEVTMTENRIRAHVSFSSISLISRRYISPAGADLAEYIGKENADLWTFIRANPSIPEMLVGIVNKMDAYCRDKGRDFHDLQFGPCIMDNDDNFMLPIIPISFRG